MACRQLTLLWGAALTALFLFPAGSSARQCPDKYSSYVIGVAAELDLNHLSVFVRSWRSHSPETGIVLYVTYVPPDVDELFKEFCVQAEVTKLPRGAQWVNARIKLYERTIKRVVDHAAMIALADVRDVAVQTNLWTDPIALEARERRAVVFSLEGRVPLPIKRNHWNDKWIKGCFGDEVYETMKDLPISCAGFTFGQAQAMLAFVQTWLQVRAGSKCPDSYVGGDQAAHQYILHFMGPRGLAKFPMMQFNNSVSAVNMMGLSFPHKHDSFYRVLREDGTPYPVLHQYDRSINLTLDLFSQFPVTQAGTYAYFQIPRHRQPRTLVRTWQVGRLPA